MKKIAIITLMMCFIFSCTTNENGLPDGEIGNSTLKENTISNVSYGKNPQQQYDIYLPAGRDNNTPVILMLHGGAGSSGNKEELNGYVNLIKNKWKNVAIVNMNYRLASNSQKIHHNEIMADIKTVIGHVIDKQNDYHISKNMGIVGGSAGGQLAMIYAYKYNDYKNIKCVANLFGPSIISDWAWYNTNNIWLGSFVGDILTQYVGQPWDENVYKSVSPYWNISAESQPTIIFHGNLDPIVPVYQSQWMHGKLNTLKVTNEYHEFLALHGFDDTQSQDVVAKMKTFFEKYLIAQK